MAFDFHAQHNNAASATALTEAHNNYVQQLHAANGMIDQYYRETLPELLQVGHYFRFRNFCDSVKNLICVRFFLHFCGFLHLYYNYVQQPHGMIDQYYRETLRELLQVLGRFNQLINLGFNFCVCKCALY